MYLKDKIKINKSLDELSYKVSRDHLPFCCNVLLPLSLLRPNIPINQLNDGIFLCDRRITYDPALKIYSVVFNENRS